MLPQISVTEVKPLMARITLFHVLDRTLLSTKVTVNQQEMKIWGSIVDLYQEIIRKNTVFFLVKKKRRHPQERRTG